MKSVVLKALVAGSVLFGYDAAACNHPDSIAIPDGFTATRGEMIAASDNAKAYARGMRQFFSCLDGEANGFRVSSRHLDLRARVAMENRETGKRNAAVEELIEVSAIFQAAVEDYKATL